MSAQLNVWTVSSAFLLATSSCAEQAFILGEERSSTLAIEFSNTYSRGNVTTEPGHSSCSVGDLCRLKYVWGSTVTISAQAIGSSIFLTWLGDCAPQAVETSCIVYMRGDRRVIAAFAPTAGVAVDPPRGTTTEKGGSTTFNLELHHAPSSEVHLDLGSSNGAEGIVTPQSLTFGPSDWDSAQVVTVTGVDDMVHDGDREYSLIVTFRSEDPDYHPLSRAFVPLVNSDDDLRGLRVVPEQGLVTTEQGGSTFFEIRLESEPADEVSIELASSDPAEGTISPPRLSFTRADWSSPKRATVTGVDDRVADGDKAYAIGVDPGASADPQYAALPPTFVSVLNADDDQPGFIITSTIGLATGEGAVSASFELRLASQPTADVVVTFGSSNIREGTVATTDVRFTHLDWNAAHPVTATGVDDTVRDGDQTYFIVTHPAVSADPLYSGLDAEDVRAINTDDDGVGWVPTSTIGAPDPRSGHTALWTGSEMLVWGGFDGAAVGDGGKYDPVTDSWAPISAIDAPAPRNFQTGVWTGTEMIIWGGTNPTGELGDGARYDPAADTWVPTATTGAPPARYDHTAVWSGSEMIIWGGTESTWVGTGARYDPIHDRWSPVSMIAAPVSRTAHYAAWTGTEMIIWGGYTGSTCPRANDGGRYDPLTDTWRSLTTSGAPLGRNDDNNHALPWTGSEIFVWGGTIGCRAVNSGARYDPTLNGWTQLPIAGAPAARLGHSTAWTGSLLLVWGGVPYEANFGSFGDGAAFDPATNRWTPMSNHNGLSARDQGRAVWTGTEMIVWGGVTSPATIFHADGARYRP